jgi:hypothetical protein
MLSTIGAVAGLALVPIGGTLLSSLAPIGVAAVTISSLDVRVLTFTFAIAIATGLLFSVAPAIHDGRVSLQEALQQHARSAVGAGSRLTRDALVVLQIAAASRAAGRDRTDDPRSSTCARSTSAYARRC